MIVMMRMIDATSRLRSFSTQPKFFQKDDYFVGNDKTEEIERREQPFSASAAWKAALNDVKW
jgi:hypothetical protein